MHVLNAIAERTSYRGPYQATKVPREDLVKIMEAGLAAPSGCNKQTTSLIGVDDEQVLAKLYELAETPLDKAAPAMICVLTQHVIAYRNKAFGVQDYSAAIENMLLAAVGLGYQSCWYEGQITDEDAIGRKMADMLSVPADYEMVCFLPIGVAAKPVRHVQKKPFEQRAWFNGFNQ